MNANGYRTTQVYDQASQRVVLIDARGNRYTFTFDNAGRETRRLDPLLRRTTFAYDPADRQVTAMLKGLALRSQIATLNK